MQNRLRVDIVPGATLDLMMGVNAQDNVLFLGLWEKTLTRVSKVQGTGLGMSVVKGFTDLMGGTLTIHSKLGEGSTFLVELPFPPATEEERQAVLRPQTDEETLRPAYIGKKVLLVEDHALNAEIAMELLQIIGL